MTEFDSPFPYRDDLGEGPAWDADTARLWRVDLHVGLVHGVSVLTGEQRTINVGADVSFVLPTTTDEIAVGHGLDIKLIDPKGNQRILSTVDGPANTRFNDGKTDPFGRIVGGTLLLDLQNDVELLKNPVGVPRIAGLFQIEGSGHSKCLGAEMMLGNGLDWDVPRRRFYHVDSLDQCIYVYDYDPETGECSNRRVFAAIPKEQGLPDGLSVDAEGGIWLALFFTGEIRHYDPDGRIVERIATPVSCPTSICFGGPDLRTAFVTSARRYVSEAELPSQPLAGAVLTFEPGVQGQPTTKVRL